MEGPVRRIEIIRVSSADEPLAVEDELLSERAVSLYIDGKYDGSAVITAGSEELWAAGNMRCRGLISSYGDIEKISSGGYRVDVILKRKPIEVKPEPLPLKWSVGASVVRRKIAELAGAELYRRTGCLHVALLSSVRGKTLFSAEDISRHNAVDKAVGWLLRSGINAASSLLFISGRMPEDMVQKAVCAGIPFIASVSAPTADAVTAARAANITMIGFARGGSFNIYSAAGRVALREKEL
ncbi:formate dehydrogenase accessory sulfurtransferase FdhD [Cloacibacillus sp.]|uniref:formate dehydrogenase accessory sulfurtransferase FdhD n=1 Tax=Cloacibacillus sp. TaxID=2049023 RepID=UPI0025BCD8BE|nr:formate dehydrogenase accessory sulfurtransferase FdhD [Cloacibacillus sp.]MCC8057082.1 formate dehydrogenase accessory sulfurtransferase FdhD [Cloacibacillus sp.]